MYPTLTLYIDGRFVEAGRGHRRQAPDIGFAEIVEPIEDQHTGIVDEGIEQIATVCSVPGHMDIGGTVGVLGRQIVG